MSLYDIELQGRLLWILTYASVIASEKESVETAVMQANEAVTRYYAAWGPEKPLQEVSGG